MTVTDNDVELARQQGGLGDAEYYQRLAMLEALRNVERLLAELLDIAKRFDGLVVERKR